MGELKRGLKNVLQIFLLRSATPDLQQYESLVRALSDAPKGLRCLKRDYAINMRLKDIDITSAGAPEPSPQVSIPIPLSV